MNSEFVTKTNRSLNIIRCPGENQADRVPYPGDPSQIFFLLCMQVCYPQGVTWGEGALHGHKINAPTIKKSYMELAVLKCSF